MIKVLLIDDDRRHSELLQAYCRRFGVEIDCAFDGEQGLRRLASNPPDLLLLDVMLPGKDGFEICREIRRRSSRLPIIMLTARADVVDRVSGLELGADDYIGKPFEPRELVARIHTILRRVETRGSRVVLNFEGLVIDTATRTVQLDGASVELTSMEYALLQLLAENPGRDHSRDEILSALRGIDAAILTRSVDILVSRLRAKLGDSLKPARFIQTVWGRGYCFVARPLAE
jgi:two-component system, OmpR family, response regulator